MPTPFADPKLWQQATFTFTIHSSPKALDTRGNVISVGTAIAVTFKLKKSGGGGGNKGTSMASDSSAETYECRVVKVDGDENNPILPASLGVKDIGEGELNGRKCRATIKSVAQSSLSPLLSSILGSAVTLEIDYRIRRGSDA